MNFKEWMERVDDALMNEVGLSYRDLPDFAYRDAFEDGATPNDIAWEVLALEGYSN